MFFFTLSSFIAYGNDHETISFADHEFLISEYIKADKQYDNPIENKVYQIVIYDFEGNIIRQFELDGGLEFKSPEILQPMINKSLFLTEIDRIYYYIYTKNNDMEKKLI